jgi:DNA repair exonuclease SbcCD ATPase subunit
LISERRACIYKEKGDLERMNTKKALIGAVVLALIAGLVAGYGFWGREKEEKVDVKQLMHRAIKEIEVIQNESRELKKMHEQNKQRIEKATALVKENETLQRQLQEAQQKKDELKVRLKQINTELAEARQKSLDVDKLKELRDTLETRVATLKNENFELKTKLEQISNLSTRQEPGYQEEIQQELLPQAAP